MHPYGQIGALDMRRRNAAHVRSADFDVWDSPQNPARAIPIVGTDLSVNFVKLPKVHVRSKPLADRAHVRLKRIAGDLIAAHGSLSKVKDEPERAETVPSADVMGDHQLGFAVHTKPEIKAAPFFGIVKAEVVFLGMTEAPQLVELHEARADVLDLGVEDQASLSLLLSASARESCACAAP